MRAIITQLYLFYLQFLNGIFGISAVVSNLERCRSIFIPSILRKYKAQVGEILHCKSGLLLENVYGDQDSKHDFSNLKIGKNCFIGRSVLIDLTDEVILEDNVVISSRVSILTHTDTGNRNPSSKLTRSTEKVHIGENTYIGTGAIILQGVTLGKNCIVGAGAVVRQSFPDDSFLVGNPAMLKN